MFVDKRTWLGRLAVAWADFVQRHTHRRFELVHSTDAVDTMLHSELRVPAGSPGADFSQITEEHCNGDSARFFCTEGRR